MQTKDLKSMLVEILRIDTTNVKLNFLRQTFSRSPQKPIISSANNVESFFFATRQMIRRPLTNDVNKIRIGTLKWTKVAQFLFFHVFFLQKTRWVTGNKKLTIKQPLSVTVIGSSSDVMKVSRQSVTSASPCSIQVYWRNSEGIVNNETNQETYGCGQHVALKSNHKKHGKSMIKSKLCTWKTTNPNFQLNQKSTDFVRRIFKKG